MVLTRAHGIYKDSWHGQGLMVLTTPMALTKTHGIESVILNPTRTRGPSVTRMRNFLLLVDSDTMIVVGEEVLKCLCCNSSSR